MRTRERLSPSPIYRKDGSYRMRSAADVQAAAIATIKNILMIPGAYGSQGPGVVLREIEHAARQFTDALAAERLRVITRDQERYAVEE